MITLHRTNRTTLVMVTNDLQRAYQVSDRIGFCHNKTLEMFGSAEQVKASKHPELNRFIYANALLSESGGNGP